MVKPPSPIEALSQLYRLDFAHWSPELCLTLELRKQDEATANYHRYLIGITPLSSTSLAIGITDA